MPGRDGCRQGKDRRPAVIRQDSGGRADGSRDEAVAVSFKDLSTRPLFIL